MRNTCIHWIYSILFLQRSLRSINLFAVEIVGEEAFDECKAFTCVKFSNKLERRIEQTAFAYCTSLERITIPLNDGLIIVHDIFDGCRRLNHVELWWSVSFKQRKRQLFVLENYMKLSPLYKIAGLEK